jgi:hypothetical protein
MTLAGPTFRPPHAVFAAFPLPEEPATALGAPPRRQRRPSCRVRIGEPFLAGIAQCPRPFSLSAVGARVSVDSINQPVAAQGVAAIMFVRPAGDP